ncbi:MAG TPA: radical SAM protein [Phycisphaerae bacterium]|nr:radical SAM protein [Phycisphaerae bacterium]
MHVVLVSTYAYPVALGMRYVSSWLKQAGHRVSCLFIGSERDEFEPVSAALRADFVEHCRRADVVGLSLMTNSFDRSCELTRALRDAGIRAPIVWGGTHPTVAPQESAEVADYVCIGEGEKAMLEFVGHLEAGRDPGVTRGFAYLKDGRLVRNPIYPLTDDLDAYPFPDYDLQDHRVAHKGRLVPASPRVLRGTLRRYRLSSTRGCPFSCSFCNNGTQLGIYKEAGYAPLWVRKRSVESIIAEIEHFRDCYPDVEEINLVDDLFLIRGEHEVKAFVEAYAERVNLPLQLDAFPNTVTEAKIATLSRLPSSLISMGIQSGSQDTLLNTYNRPTRVEQVAEAIRIIADAGLRAEYHYLVGNPFESERSLVETLRFVADHHRGPAKVRIFPLQFYPGSVMYERARAEGVIDPRPEAAYRGVYSGKAFIKQARYLEIWLRIVLSLRGAGVSSKNVHRVINFALHPTVRRLIDHRWFAPVAFMLYRVGRILHKNLIVKPASVLRPRRKGKREPPIPHREAA